MYLSAVNWYHLEDKSKVHYFTEQIINLNPSYSAECYKIKAVCYFKTFEYSKSLAYVTLFRYSLSNAIKDFLMSLKVMICRVKSIWKWKNGRKPLIAMLKLTSLLKMLILSEMWLSATRNLTNLMKLYNATRL